MRGFAAALLAVVALGSPAAAFDKVLLKDGRTIEGTLVPGTDAAVVHLKVKDVDVPIPAGAVVKTFEENLDSFKPKTPEEEDNLKKGWVLFEGHWMSKSSRDDLLGKRAAADKAAVEDLKKKQNWKNAVTKESAHFSMKSNADPALVDDYLARLEEFYKYFTDDWGVKVSAAKGGKLSVELHRSAGDMFKIGGGGGAFMFSFDSGSGAINLYYDREDPDSTLRTLYEEAYRQFSFFVDPKFWYPGWVRDGLADYYATTVHGPDGKLQFGAPQYGYVLELDRDRKDNKLPPLMEILDDTNTKWDEAHFAVEWSFVHFLMESPKYGKAFRAFVGNLPNNKDAGIHQEIATAKGAARNMVDNKLCISALEKRLGAPLSKLDQEWHAWLAQDVPMTPDAYFLAAESTLNKATDAGPDDEPPPEEQANRDVQRAFDLFAQADGAGIKSPLFYRRYAELLRKGGIVESDTKIVPRPPDGAMAWKMIQKAIALDPVDPESYVEAAGDLLVDSPIQDLDRAAMYADVAKIVAGPRDLLIKSLADEIYARIEPAREHRRKAAADAAVAAKTDNRKWMVAFFYVLPAKPPDNLVDLTTQQLRDLIRGGKVGAEDSVFQSWRQADPKTGALVPGADPWDTAWIKLKDCPLFADDLAAAPKAGAPAKPAAPAGGAGTAGTKGG
jgi:hypothetical protein